MAAITYLIVNADDFGLSPGVNRGIVETHERGIVTSASLMVRWPAAAEAAAYARRRLQLSLGLHVDLGEWRYRDGDCVPVYEVVPLDDPEAMFEEVTRQLDAFRHLTGAEPSHIDSHQHVHRHEPARSVLRDLAGTLSAPLRHETPAIRYCGDFYGQTAEGVSRPNAIRVDGLIDVLAGLHPGFTELACHPGLDEDLDTMYSRERSLEVATLCDPRVHEALVAMDIELRAFHGLPVAAPE